jgi:hypothetical protein
MVSIIYIFGLEMHFNQLGGMLQDWDLNIMHIGLNIN